MKTSGNKSNKGTPPRRKLDAEYVQAKITLIEQGLPIDISEDELLVVEETLRGARSFYIDMLTDLHLRRDMGEDLEHHIVEESKNLAGVEIALRKIDDFRKEYAKKISKK